LVCTDVDKTYIIFVYVISGNVMIHLVVSAVIGYH
jgi:hypothetical protein